MTTPSWASAYSLSCSSAMCALLTARISSSAGRSSLSMSRETRHRCEVESLAVAYRESFQMLCDVHGASIRCCSCSPFVGDAEAVFEERLASGCCLLEPPAAARGFQIPRILLRGKPSILVKRHMRPADSAESVGGGSTQGGSRAALPWTLPVLTQSCPHGRLYWFGSTYGAPAGCATKTRQESPCRNSYRGKRTCKPLAKLRAAFSRPCRSPNPLLRPSRNTSRFRSMYTMRPRHRRRPPRPRWTSIA